MLKSPKNCFAIILFMKIIFFITILCPTVGSLFLKNSTSIHGSAVSSHVTGEVGHVHKNREIIDSFCHNYFIKQCDTLF
jgi:hypothetical protein